MEEYVQELSYIDINCKIIKEFVFGNIHGITFGILQDNNQTIINTFIKNNIVPVLFNKFDNNFELHNLITNKKLVWKSNIIIKKHLSPCECLLCQQKIKIKNELFYNIAESIIL
jgi:hypothetical protein